MSLPPPRPLWRTETLRFSTTMRALILFLITVVVLSGTFAVAPRARAIESCAASFSNLHWKADSTGVHNNVYDDKYDRAVVEFDWAVADGAHGGDKFSITLPSQLATGHSGEVELRDEEGNLVATANVPTWSRTVEFTLTSFVDTNFDVTGSAYFTVAWNRDDDDLRNNGFGSKETPGDLVFGGCGDGTLKGYYPKDGPSGHDNPSYKTGVYYGPRPDQDFYPFTWTIAPGSKTGTSEFVVTDSAPAGHKFACDGKYDYGRPPAFLYVIVDETQAPIENYIIDGRGLKNGGTNNFTNVNKQLPDGDGYRIDCTDTELTVTFPHGIDPNTSPRIQLITYSDTKPLQQSKVSNTAFVAGKAVSATVDIPAAGGWAQGKKGGFVLHKAVEGLTASANKEYSFDWKCTSGESIRSGTTKLKADGSAHVSDLDKDAHCTITEQPAAENGYEHNTEWNLEGTKSSGQSVEFDIRTPDEVAVAIEATNTYTPTGTFRIEKKVVDNGVNVDKNKEFTVNYTCTKKDAPNKTGSLVLKAGETKESPAIPEGYTCAAEEDAASAKVNNARVDIDNGTSVKVVAPTPSQAGSELITVTNTYHQELGAIALTKVIGGLAAGSSNGSPQNPREFDVEVSWKDSTGKQMTEQLVIREGQETLLEGLPVGTEVSIKEIMPRDTALTTWSTPGFSTTNTDANLVDHNDGTATLTVPASATTSPVQIAVHNTANIPWWWILIPIGGVFIPPLIEHGSSGSSSTEVSSTTTVHPTPAPSAVPTPAEKSPVKEEQPKPTKRLATTGAQVGVIALIGLLATLLGVLFLALRRRNQ